MPGDWFPEWQDNHTQEPEMVREESGAAEEIYPFEEGRCFPVHSMPDPVRDRCRAVCTGIYGMDRGNPEHKGEASGD